MDNTRTNKPSSFILLCQSRKEQVWKTDNQICPLTIQLLSQEKPIVGLMLLKAVNLQNLWLASLNFSISCKAGGLLLVIDRDFHCNTRRVKRKIYIRLHPNNINRDDGIEIPEAWLPLIKKHNSRRSVRKRTTEATAHTNNEDAPISAAKNRPTRIELGVIY